MKRRLNFWLALAAVLCGVSLVVGLRGTGGPASDAPAPDPVAPPHVLVLNGAGRAGLAREISLLLGPVGCVAAGVGNAPGPDWPGSVLVNRRLEPSRAAVLAERLGGLPVLREWDERSAEDAVLVLGGDWELVRRALGSEGGVAGN